MVGKKKPPEITTQQVMEVLRYHSARELRVEQAKLTTAANQVKALIAGRLHVLFTGEELECMLRTAELIQTLGARIEHAKEVTAREERRQERERKRRERLIDDLVSRAIPAPEETPQSVLDMAELALSLHREGVILQYLPIGELLEGIRRALAREVSCKKLNLGAVARSLHSDITDGLREALTVSGQEPGIADMQSIMCRAEQHREGVRADYARTFDYIRTQLAITTSDNVERLPTRMKPAGR